MRPVLSFPQASTAKQSANPARERDLLAAPVELTGSIVAEKYQLGPMLGRGGMGVVYEATHRWTGRRVALKLIHPVLADDPALATRFLQEARAAARLEHPHVVDVLDMGRADDGTVYQALSLLEGETLGERLKREGCLGWRQLLTLLLPVIDALSAAHAQGVIHRDVKPENIFLHRGERGDLPVLLDFGMAKLLDACSTGTPSSAVFGTPYYMAPEQALGASQVGRAADVWSMGAVLFGGLSGALPFGKLPAVAYLAHVISHDVPSLSSVAPDVPAPLASVVDRALQRDLTKRFGSMSELSDALCLAAKQIDPSFEVPSFSRALPSRRAQTTRPRLAWAAMGLLAAVLCGLAFLPGSRAEPKPIVDTPSPSTAPATVSRPAGVTTPPTAPQAEPPLKATVTEPQLSHETPPVRRGQTLPKSLRVAPTNTPRVLPPGMTEDW